VFLKTIKNKIFKVVFIIFALILGGFLVYSHFTAVMPDMAISFMNEVKIPAERQKVLFISPHPDDEVLAAGGFITRAVKNGAEVKIILVTDGNKHGLKDVRCEEFKQVTETLGVDSQNLIFLNYPDGKLKENLESEVELSLKANIAIFKPDFLLFPSSADTHPDHATVGKITDKIVRGNKGFASYTYLVHSNGFPRPKAYKPNLFILPPMRLVNFDNEWQKFTLRADEEKVKEEAVLKYQSQLKTPFLKSLMLSMIRKNELFINEVPND
jgi:LmbE family N-acetylglucosaminyl deacetylase